MRKTKFLSVLLAVFTIISALSLTAAAFAVPDTLDGAKEERALSLSPGLTYHELSFTAYDYPEYAYILEYQAGHGTEPMITYGNKLCGRSTVSEMAASVAEKQGLDVVGGINGDFFSYYTGIPLGVCIADGKLVSTSEESNAIGFLADGGVLLGKPETTITATVSGKKYTVDHLNKFPTVYGIYMVNFEYDGDLNGNFDSTKIIMTITDGDFSLGGETQCKITKITKSADKLDIGEKDVVIVVPDGVTGASDYSRLSVGNTMTVSFSVSKGWDKVVTAVGGGDIILEDGEIPDGIVDEDHEKARNPRTAIGVRKDGSMVFIALDGRQTPYSDGRTLTGIAETLKALGCVDGINLDGGGSTEMVYKYTNDEGIIVANSPSDGAERAVSNALLFVNTLEASGEAKELRFSPSAPAVQRGGSVNLSVELYDTNGKIIERTNLAKLVKFTVDKTYGSMNGGKYTTAHLFTGNALVSASVTGISGQTMISVTERDPNDTSYIQRIVFNDLEEHWAYDDVMALYRLGVVDGVTEEDGTRNYYPDNTLTRAEFSKLICGLVGIGVTQYDDVTLTYRDKADIPEWSLPYVKAALGSGLMSGRTNGDGSASFAPNDKIKRVEVMKVCSMFVSADGATIPEFTDKSDIPQWAADAVRAAVGAGLFTGYSDGTLNPNGFITRGEIAAVLTRLTEKG